MNIFNKTSKKKKQKKIKSIKKKQTILKIDDSDIKGFRDEIREKNFNKILLKAYKKEIKTIIVTNYEYRTPKRYNVKNEIKKRKLLK